MYLGFDFGMRSIGVAVGQPVTKTARPLAALRAKRGEPDWREVDQLLSAWQPKALIVGLPLNMDGTSQWITEAAYQFCQQLAAHTTLPVHQVDERLSTVEAKQLLFDRAGYKGLQKSMIDSLSASLILEMWLSSEGG